MIRSEGAKPMRRKVIEVGNALASTLLANSDKHLVCVLAQLLALQAAGLRPYPHCCRCLLHNQHELY